MATAIFSFLPNPAYCNEPIFFDASASYCDVSGYCYIFRYEWDFGDGFSTTTTQPTFVHDYALCGSYTVTLTIVCQGPFGTFCGEATTTQEIFINSPENPTAIFSFAPNPALCNQAVEFDASSSHSDPCCPIVSYDWDFGDGNGDTGLIVSHSYTSIGTYTVTLTITDSSGNIDITTNVVHVICNSPTADFIIDPNPAYCNQTVTFDASDSISDPCCTIVSYYWDFGDGNSTTTTEPDVSYTYTSVGNYTVTLIVTDNSDNQGATEHYVEVICDSPTAIFSFDPDPTYCNQTVTFNALDSVLDPCCPIVSYYWEFGDGNSTTTTEPDVSCTYTSIGNYTVTLTITDSSGNQATTTNVVYVLHKPTRGIPFC